MKALTEILEREGGHVFVLFVLLVLCAVVIICFPTNAEAVSMAKDGCKAFGGMFAYAMKGIVGPKSEIRNPKSETTTEGTE